MNSTDVIISESQLESIFKQHCCKFHHFNIMQVIWNNLSADQQNKFGLYLPCLTHYNYRQTYDTFDAPSPLRINCPKCKQENDEKLM